MIDVADRDAVAPRRSWSWAERAWRPALVVLVATTFVTRLRIEVWSAGLRLEHFAGAVCLILMLAAGRAPQLRRAARERTSLAFAAFIGWSAVVSLLRSPATGLSLRVVGWLALDWVILAVLVASEDGRLLVWTAVLAAGAYAVVSIGLWTIGQVTGTNIGRQFDVITQSHAASGLSFEANIFGSTLALYAFVAITAARGLPGWIRYGSAAAALVGVALSLSRASVLAVAVGLVIWAAIEGRAARRILALVVASAAVAALTLSVVAPGVARPLRLRAERILDLRGGTGGQRARNWSIAYHDLHGIDWIVGFGTNSYGQRHEEFTLPGKGIPGYLPSLPFQVLYDTGLVGCLLMAVLLSTLIPNSRARGARAAGLLATYLVFSMATSPFWFASTWLLVALAMLDRGREPA